ncbi:SusC/RagA family TonB-linked outer membrane protein [Zunongwangia endophytica]|uniref:SusC/RagA family TonB-linked outer membrane protein n=1 Tax=Zunongwangia endophytica TaxID=1808945 RepID=A0ABV8H6W3_9FLAO|nr:SusC/RagA family TonB-linked outer membrane protein [Zunongwangia endophytica]MDN3594833.1 SusC/RagA family TonB-linked outer membrane protein [Zunongwangia endophytica]
MKQITTKVFTVFLCLCGFLIYAQDLNDQRSISGNVTDSGGDILPGVNVFVKGTQNGVVTDMDGRYTIRAYGRDTLVFSFIGMKTTERYIGGERNIDVVLSDDNEQLDDVVVVGYGEQKREHLTGAVETVDMEEIEDLPVGNLATALRGKLPGVNISGGSVRPGLKPTLTIRNPITLSKDGGNNQPLYIIDGVLQIDAQGRNDNTLFNQLDPSEVQSISILKDAAAAVYGSRGANGAVVIKTKRGQAGPPQFSYNGSYGITDEQERTKMLSAAEYARFINELNGPYGNPNVSRDDSNSANYFFSDDEIAYFENNEYDWLDRAWSSATTQRHSVNVSGGAEGATYFGGASYYQQTGNLSEVDYDKWTFRAGTSVDIASGLNANLQVSGNFSNRSSTFNKVTGENAEDDYNSLLRAPRYIPPYINGLPVNIPDGGVGGDGYHYFAIQNLNNYAENQDQTLTFNMNLEYEVPFVDGLSFRATYGRNMGTGKLSQLGTIYELYNFETSGDNGHIYLPDAQIIGEPIEVENGDRIFYRNSDNFSEQYNFVGTYNQTFGKHAIGALATIERGETEGTQQQVLREEVAPDSNGQFNSAFGNVDGYTWKYESGSLSYVGRLNYRYNDKYLFEFLYRSDASTKFAPENYWGHFYSISGGWIISKENFFNSDVLDFLKIRFSHGKLGKDDTKMWAWRQRYTFQLAKGGVFGGDSPRTDGFKMELSPNRDAVWSDDYKNNLGIDMQFFDRRLNVTVDAFYNQGRNMLIERTGAVPFSIGGTVAAENYGEVNFWGGEISLGWQDNIGQDFSYGIDVNSGWSTNKVLVGNFDETSVLPWNASQGEMAEVGTWGYDYLGMFKDQADIDAYVDQYNIQQVFGIPTEDLRPGMLYYRDVRGEHLGDGEFAEPDGIINENDRVELEKPNNRYGIGSTIRLKYKNFSIQATLGMSWGGFDAIDARDIDINSEINQNFASVPSIWNDIYNPDTNPNGKMPNPYFSDINAVPSEFWRVSSFRFTMPNLNVGYSLPRETAENLNLSSLSVRLTALNPFNFYNPYSYKSANSAWGGYPILQTFSLGLNIRP